MADSARPSSLSMRSRAALSRASRLAANPLLRKLAGGAALGGAIKIIGMGLAFVFFVVIARVTTPEQYGIFAAAFSLATIAGFAATLGQHTAILRFWPALDEAHGPDIAAHAVARGLKLTGLGAVAVLLIFGLFGFARPQIAAFGADPLIYPAIGLMSAAFALSEYGAGALRARGALISALAPRDIVWRLAVIGAAFALGSLTGAGALWLAAALLICLAGGQIALLARDLWRRRSAPALPVLERDRMRHAQWGLWGNAVVGPVSQHAATVIVGIVLGPAAAGAFFAADRLAKLLSIALVGVNQIAGPMLARSWHAGRMKEVRLVFLAAAGLSFAAALAGFAVFALFGRFALSMFDPAYADAYWVLLILAAGQLVNTACGPNAVLLMMRGRERVVFIAQATWAVLTVSLSALLAGKAGVDGAAIGASIGLIGLNLTLSYIVLNPSLFCGLTSK